MPTIDATEVNHPLDNWADYESTLEDPLFDEGERLPSLYVVEDAEKDSERRFQVIGSRNLFQSLKPFMGRGKLVNVRPVPAGLSDNQADPLTHGLTEEEAAERAPKKRGRPKKNGAESAASA